MTTTFNGLRDIIVRDFELPPERLAPDTPLEEIELDSLAVTELVFALEDEFHVTAGNTVPAFVTLGDIANYIDRLVVERAESPAVARAAETTAPAAKTARGPRKAAAVNSAPAASTPTRKRSVGTTPRKAPARGPNKGKANPRAGKAAAPGATRRNGRASSARSNGRAQ